MQNLKAENRLETSPEKEQTLMARCEEKKKKIGEAKNKHSRGKALQAFMKCRRGK
jgi:hypothetical protein